VHVLKIKPVTYVSDCDSTVRDSTVIDPVVCVTEKKFAYLERQRVDSANDRFATLDFIISSFHISVRMFAVNPTRRHATPRHATPRRLKVSSFLPFPVSEWRRRNSYRPPENAVVLRHTRGHAANLLSNAANYNYTRFPSWRCYIIALYGACCGIFRDAEFENEIIILKSRRLMR